MEPDTPGMNDLDRKRGKENYDVFPIYPTGKLSPHLFPHYVFLTRPANSLK